MLKKQQQQHIKLINHNTALTFYIQTSAEPSLIKGAKKIKPLLDLSIMFTKLTIDTFH